MTSEQELKTENFLVTWIGTEPRDNDELKKKILLFQDKAKRFDKFVEHDDFAKAHDCNICGDVISYQINENSSQNTKLASMGWICNECETDLKNKQHLMMELKEILQVFEERKEFYGKKELEVLVDEIIKAVWNKK